MNRKCRVPHRTWSSPRATSSSAASCEYQLLRKLDEKLGRSPKAVFDDDEMLQHAAVLGDRPRAQGPRRFRRGVRPLGSGRRTRRVRRRPGRGHGPRHACWPSTAESIDALRSGADVVFQAAFFDGQFHGRSDFLVRQADGSYAVFDTKLARHAKVTALLQLAAYGDQLLKAGITPDPTVTLVLGATVPLPDGGFDYVRSHHKLSDILPVFRERRDRFLALTSAHLAQPGTVQWDAPGLTACGRCDYCQEQVAATDDLLLVARMNSAQRKKLRADGIRTVRELAEATLANPNASLLRLQDQARMQSGVGAADGEVRFRQGRRRAQHPLRRDPGKHAGRAAPAQRRRHLLRLRGRSAVAGKRHRSLGAGVPVRRHRGAHRARRRRRVQAVLGAQPGGGETGLPRLPRLCAEAPAGLPGHARLPLRRLREDGAPEALRDARCRRGHRGRVAARRAPGGSVPDRPEQHPDLRELLQHQEARAALHGDEPALRGREGRRRLGGCLCPVLRCARRRPGRGSRRHPRRDLRLQRIRLPLHPGAPELAPGPGPGARHHAGRRRARRRRVPDADDGGRARTPARSAGAGCRRPGPARGGAGRTGGARRRAVRGRP